MSLSRYYSEERLEIDLLLPDIGGSWLEIGAGGLVVAKRMLRVRDIHAYDYIEPVYASADVDPRIKKVAETVEEWQPPSRAYDVLLALDVIEHVADTRMFLAKVAKTLVNHGFFITSVPNVAHYSILRRLLQGEFNYTKTGILDETHVRFFTPRSFDNLISSFGFTRKSSLYKTRVGTSCRWLRRYRCYQYLALWQLAL